MPETKITAESKITMRPVALMKIKIKTCIKFLSQKNYVINFVKTEDGPIFIEKFSQLISATKLYETHNNLFKNTINRFLDL